MTRALMAVPDEGPAGLVNLRIHDLMTLGKLLIGTGFLPDSIKTAEQATAIMLKGQELRVPPMYALSNIAIVKGKPTCSAELMLALVRRDHGPQAMRVKDSTNDACTVEWRQVGWDGTQTYTFTMPDAVKAGLTKNTIWSSYPAAMLRARCISAVVRMAFPESIAGMYSPGEMGEQVIVTEDGEVVSGAVEPTDDPHIIEAVTRQVAPERPQAVNTAQDATPPANAAQGPSAQSTAAKERADDYRTTQNARYHATAADIGLNEPATKAFALAFFPTKTSRTQLTGQELHDVADAAAALARLADGSTHPLVDFANAIAAAPDAVILRRIATDMKATGVGTDWLRTLWQRRNGEVPATTPLVEAPVADGEAGADKWTM